ncbi:germacradienol/geosmin synthase [Actinocorallia herbida]|uniref:Germacradienol/geosmin synthase n=1 Tax=Actinocorallia herbida TaxID=58109 RepID=A0A3N1CR59_9ACTN|nr:terpene synthase family protein [Actinocorallia herbida]ROO83789.1 germacradienol/geosmin synthase [Actinocorallia herbida]
MDVSLLLPLAERIPALVAPCRVHELLFPIGEESAAWASGHGLILGESDATRLGRGRFERLACRLLPDVPPARAVLVTEWLIWLFALDDHIDDGGLGTSATAVDALYEPLILTLRRGTARPGSGVLETALADLWNRTVPGMSQGWRRRFRDHLSWHRQGCLDEAVARRTGELPAPTRYAAVRRGLHAPFLLDLLEPALGTEVPVEVLGTKTWQTLLEGTADVTAWCNDLVAYTREDHGPLNAVAATSRQYGLPPRTAAAVLVHERVWGRLEDVADAARNLDAEMRRLRLDPGTARGVSRVACALLSAPRAQLDWLHECGRYSPMPDPSVPSPRRKPRVTLT